MRKYLLTTVALATISTPAVARDGSGYVGLEAGLLFPRDGDLEIDVVGDDDFDTDTSIDYKRGRDLDIIAGYDFGGFRLEGEIAWKRTRADEIELEDDDDADVSELGNTRVKVRSLMLNALADFGDETGFSFYAGGGIGRARMKVEGDRDSAWAWQLIAGARTALSSNIDAGLKYRYFQTRKLRFDTDAEFDDEIFPLGLETKFSSHSLLASLIFNFGAPPAPPPPPPPPPPPAPMAPATQTCPDGSVILATDVCPLPPPPPPPPPPPSAGERG